MKGIIGSKRVRRLATFFIVLVLTLSCSMSAFAATGIYLGSGNVYYANGDIDYDVRGYVYYNSNTSSALNLSSLVQWIYNYGVYDVKRSPFYSTRC